jgi:outer membrane protein OmpA-like peptidoglycan-associated protein
VAAQDQFGNRAEVTKQLKTDVFVIEEDGELKIKISSIHFVADEADFEHLEDVKVQQNMETLDRVAEILKRYTEYQITIEGHATHEYLQHEGAMKWEQENELIPLSRKRAEAVKEALVDRGVEEAQLQTAGVGGAEPVVPHNDLENRWKNRRVEFILERNTDRQGRAE